MSNFSANFATRTEFKNYTGKKFENNYVVASDIGYSSVKFICNNKYGCFPAFAKEIDEKYLNDNDESVIGLKDHSTGKTWLVGEEAIQSRDTRERSENDSIMCNRARTGTEMYKIIAITSIAIALVPIEGSATNYEAKDKIIVQAGLPHDIMNTDKYIAKKAFATAKNAKYTLTYKCKTYHFTLNIPEDNVFIMSQPQGSFFSATTNHVANTQNSIKDLGTNSLIFDPGFGTLDIFPMRGSSVQTGQTFRNVGMMRVFELTVDKINKKYITSYSLDDLLKVLKQGYFLRNSSTEVDEYGIPKLEKLQFDNELKEACKEVFFMAMKEVVTHVPDLHDYRYIIVTGGTGDAWSKYLQEFQTKRLPNTKIIFANHNSDFLPLIYSNVRGYFLARTANLKLKSKKNKAKK